VPFTFATVLVGPVSTLDLIVVIDTVQEQERDVQRQVHALAQALDVCGSRMALTAVLVGPPPRGETLTALSSVCRVLPVGTLTSSEDRELENWLSVFKPLDLPEPSEAALDSMSELSTRDLGMDKALFQEFTDAARHSPASVEATLKAVIERALGPLASTETK
jgi:hypothetical protein